MSKHATLYRMVTDEHICPFGLKSKYLLEHEGFEVEDHALEDRQETDHFKADHHVKTTPQTFIDGERIGGYDDLRAYFGLAPAKPEGTTYTPVIAIFSTTALMALALHWSRYQQLLSLQALLLFIALSMSVLAILKLRDLESFSNQFLGYDLLAQRWVPYAYLYPFAEAFAGIGMLAGVLTPLVAGVSLVIGTIGAVSVFKAVYLDKRQLKCACVGGDSKVPLGLVSLTENLMMIIAGLWMGYQALS